MGFVPAPMDDVQRAVIEAITDGSVDRARPGLIAAESNRIWLSPPALTVAAALLTVLATEVPDRPWAFTDALWDEHLPDQKPGTEAEWRRASYAVQAAGRLAGGVWLDVGTTESYWRGPFWPDVLPVIELLANVTLATLPLTREQLVQRLRQLLTLSTPAIPLA
jgi:hypothetical protein